MHNILFNIVHTCNTCIEQHADNVRQHTEIEYILNLFVCFKQCILNYLENKIISLIKILCEKVIHSRTFDNSQIAIPFDFRITEIPYFIVHNAHL